MPTLFTRSFLFVSLLCPHALAEVVDFEDWELATNTAWVGPVEHGNEEPGTFGGTVRTGTFQSRSVAFENRHNLDFGSWSGFAVSNRTDTSTPGFMNDTSAFALPTSGQHYAVGFGYAVVDPADRETFESLPHFDVPDNWNIQSLDVINTTYAALSMLNGDPFAKKFGGETGSDPDFFQLTIFGEDADGELLDNEIEYYLADYRGDENLVVDAWSNVDLSVIADASRVYFNLSSSDNNEFGMATPAYFAIDNLQLVERPDFDFDGDGVGLTVSDANGLCSAIAAGDLSVADLDENGIANIADMVGFLREAQTYVGDHNLDGAVDFDDFLPVAANFEAAGTWSDGDYKCDGEIGFGDFLELSANFGLGEVAAANVPEPTGLSWLLTTWLLWFRRRRR